MNSVRVNRKGAERIASGNVWIFSSDVIDRGEAGPGDVVQVIDPKGRFLGTAHFSSTSQICLRLLSLKSESADAAFFARRIAAALAYRNRSVSNSSAYRLVFGEADQLPGLVVDRYGDYLAMQTLSQGMDRAKTEIVNCLAELLKPLGIVARNEVAVRERESLPLETTMLAGEIPARVEVTMNGLRWHVDLMRGQKTGVYLDQRENYLRAARYAGGRALDCFTSTGGFALHIGPKCESVEAVDSSGPALEAARANALLNGMGNIAFREADVFDLLKSYSQARHSYDTIILDPPAFAKSRGGLEGAARGYKEINLRALRMLRPGGVLISCSCSHHFSEAMLLETIAAAALDCGKTLRVLERRTQAQDHPILLTVPETHYLKCLILEVVTP